MRRSDSHVRIHRRVIHSRWLSQIFQRLNSNFICLRSLSARCAVGPLYAASRDHVESHSSLVTMSLVRPALSLAHQPHNNSSQQQPRGASISALLASTLSPPFKHHQRATQASHQQQQQQQTHGAPQHHPVSSAAAGADDATDAVDATLLASWRAGADERARKIEAASRRVVSPPIVSEPTLSREMVEAQLAQHQAFLDALHHRNNHITAAASPMAAESSFIDDQLSEVTSVTHSNRTTPIRSHEPHSYRSQHTSTGDDHEDTRNLSRDLAATDTPRSSNSFGYDEYMVSDLRIAHRCPS